MYKSVPGREAWMIVMTVIRIGFGVGLCVSVWRQGSPYTSTAWLVSIVVADIGDGVIARRFGSDTTARRIIDTIVDRLSIHGAMAVIMWRVPGSLVLLMPIVVRDVVLILNNCRLVVTKRLIITPGILHRSGTMLYAVLYAVVLFSTGTAATCAAAVISLIVWFLLFDYLRAGELVPSNPKGEPLARYQAKGLLALRGITPPRKNSIGL